MLLWANFPSDSPTAGYAISRAKKLNISTVTVGFSFISLGRYQAEITTTPTSQMRSCTRSLLLTDAMCFTAPPVISSRITEHTKIILRIVRIKFLQQQHGHSTTGLNRTVMIFGLAQCLMLIPVTKCLHSDLLF